MAGLDTKYIPLNYLQEYFVKIAGESGLALPLAGGVVKFWQDTARTVSKDVFKLTGSAPAYTYTNIGHELTLSSSGTFIDEDGNDISVYAYPYNVDTGVVELYFIQVYSSDDEFQFSREAVPNVSSNSATADNINNYFKGGQFGVFNSNVAVDKVINITSDVLFQFSGIDGNYTNGVWLFEKSNTTATDNIMLKTIPAGQIIEASPRYYVDINCTSAGSGETYKFFGYKEINARQFENETITVSFQLKSSSSSQVSVYLRRNFGTGGSTTEDLPMGTKSISSTFSKYSFTYAVPSTSSKTFGSLNDDYWIIYISLPQNQNYNLGITNAQLNIGDVIYQLIPETFGEEAESLKSSMLPASGSFYNRDPNLDSYKPIVNLFNRKTGVASYNYYDIAPIGHKVEVFHDNVAYMNERGFYELIGTPFSKAMYREFYTLHTNKYGQNGDTRAAAVTDTVTITNVYNGATTNASDYDTGFTITTTQAGTPGVPQKTQVVCKAASTFKNGAYFKFYPSSVSYDFSGKFFAVIFYKNYLWKEPNPSPAGIFDVIPGYIPVFVLESDTADQVATKLTEAMQYSMGQLPNTQGMFFRQVAQGSVSDPDRNGRLARPDGAVGDNVGTWQPTQNLSHDHYTLGPGALININTGGGATDLNSRENRTGFTGGNQSNPINVYVRAFIKII